MELIAIPYEAIAEEAVACEVCGETIIADCYFLDPAYACDRCGGELQAEAEAKAEAEGKKLADRLVVTRQLPAYTPDRRWQPEYPESNSSKAYRACLRHEYTNYEDLLVGLNREDGFDNMVYGFVREAVDELIDAQIEADDELIEAELEANYPIPRSTDASN